VVKVYNTSGASAPTTTPTPIGTGLVYRDSISKCNIDFTLYDARAAAPRASQAKPKKVPASAPPKQSTFLRLLGTFLRFLTVLLLYPLYLCFIQLPSLLSRWMRKLLSALEARRERIAKKLSTWLAPFTRAYHALWAALQRTIQKRYASMRTRLYRAKNRLQQFCSPIGTFCRDYLHAISSWLSAHIARISRYITASLLPWLQKQAAPLQRTMQKATARWRPIWQKCRALAVRGWSYRFAPASALAARGKWLGESLSAAYHYLSGRVVQAMREIFKQNS
jgi:hypothetical protein